MIIMKSYYGYTYKNSFQYNETDSIDNIEYLDLIDSIIIKLTDKLIFPKNVTELCIENIECNEIPKFPLNLKTLKIENCKINNIPSIKNLSNLHQINILNVEIKNKNFDISESVKKLNLINCGLIELSKLPSNLKELNVSKNKLTEIKNLPEKLEMLSCTQNKIKDIVLPKNLKILVATDNKISKINIPESVYILYLSENRIEELEIFGSLYDGSIQLNPIKKLWVHSDDIIIQVPRYCSIIKKQNSYFNKHIIKVSEINL